MTKKFKIHDFSYSLFCLKWSLRVNWELTHPRMEINDRSRVWIEDSGKFVGFSLLDHVGHFEVKWYKNQSEFPSLDRP
jgi:hypothetical protein